MSHAFRCDHVKIDLNLGSMKDRYTIEGDFRGVPVTISTESKDFARLFIVPGVTVLDVNHPGGETRT